jgi:hypothetical protein
MKRAWTQLSITFFILKISSLLTEIWQTKLQQNLKNHQNILHKNGLNLVKNCPILVFFTLYRIYMKNATIFILYKILIGSL